MSDSGLVSSMVSPAHALRRGVLTLVLLAGATFAAVWTMLPVRAAARVGAAETLEGVSDAQRLQRTTRFESGMRAARDRVIGRSPFYPIPPKVEDVPVPVRYNGPGLIAMINGEAWFADGRRLRAGAPADEGLAVVELHEPWYAKLRWQGAEFSVGLFERTPVSLTDAELEPTPGVNILPPTPLPQDPPPPRPRPGDGPRGGSGERGSRGGPSPTDTPGGPPAGAAPASPSATPPASPATTPAAAPATTPPPQTSGSPSVPPAPSPPNATPEPAPPVPEAPPAEPPPPPPGSGAGGEPPPPDGAPRSPS
jgi:hypothetical protein